MELLRIILPLLFLTSLGTSTTLATTTTTPTLKTPTLATETIKTAVDNSGLVQVGQLLGSNIGVAIINNCGLDSHPLCSDDLDDP